MAAVGREHLTAMLVLAHTGHVLVDLSIFLVPVIGLIVWAKVVQWREKRRGTGSPGTVEKEGGGS